MYASLGSWKDPAPALSSGSQTTTEQSRDKKPDFWSAAGAQSPTSRSGAEEFKTRS